MKLLGNVTISKVNAGGKYFMEIRIQDENSRGTFVTARMSMEDYAHCSTGLAHQAATLEVKGLKNVGKVKEQKPLIVEMPEHCGYGDDREALAIKTARAHADEGWEISTYFRSQRSFYAKDGIEYAQTTQYRYVEVDNG